MSGKLKKSITMLEAMAIVVGMIIGSGVFLKPGIVLQNAGTPLLAIVAWVAGGIITLASALTIAEIAVAIPKSGGLYTYLKDLYGEPVGFLLGWVQTVISYPASVAAQAIAFATCVDDFIPITPWQQKFVGIGVLAFILLMNVISTKCGGVIQVVATIGKLIPIAAIIVFGFLHSSSFSLGTNEVITGGSGLGVAILGTLWAYEGWISVTNMSEEMKKPKDLPKVISLGVLFVVLVYAIFNIAVFRALPLEAIVASSNPAADAAVALFGKKGAMFISAGIMVSVFGALNGFLMTGARIPFAMGSEKMLPCSDALSKVHPKFQTPTNALLIEAVLAVIYILSGSFNTLTDLLVFVLWIFFTMGVIGIFILRKRQKPVEGAYKVPLYPIVPVIGILGGAYILISTLVADPIQSLIGIGITLVGVPVYIIISKKK